jgi:tellurium resistance protein TerD
MNEDDFSDQGNPLRYDPLDDIKPIDFGGTPVLKNETTYANPLEFEGAAKSRTGREAPVSSLVASERSNLEVHNFETNDQIFLGDFFSLTQRDPTMRQLIVAAGWENASLTAVDVDVDLTCFLLDRTDSTRIDEDFIYYNNPTGCDGAIKLLEDSRGGAGEGDDERIFFDLNGIPFDVIRIVFAISIYDPSYSGLKFDSVRDLYLRIVNYDTNEELARFVVPKGDLDLYSGMLCAQLVREGPNWFIQPLGEGVPGGLSKIAKQYGLLIAEETG